MYPELPLQEREISESVQVCMYGLKSVWNAPIIGHPLEGPRAREKREDFVKSDPVKVLFFLPPWWGHRVLKVMMTQLMLLEEAHRQQAEQGGSRGVRSTPKQKWGGRAPPHVLVPKNTFMDVFDNTCDIGNFRATASDNLRITYEAQRSRTAWRTAYWCIAQIDYGQTRHCEDWLCQRTT